MNKTGPIIVIEDDEDDRFLLASIFKEINCGNELIFFTDGVDALEYLTNTDATPFLVLSDINMPKMDGFDLRNIIYANESLRVKCIPYIFFTTAVSTPAVVEAYTLSAQGFFIKPVNYEGLFETIRTIISYWKMCYSPTSTLERGHYG